MKKLSVSELAKLYGYSRQAIYAHINKGNLSKGSDGLIDFAEALRVFGEPQKKDIDVNQSQSINSQNLTEVDLLEAPKPNITTSIDPDIAPSIDPNTSREQNTTKSKENEAKPEPELQNPRIPIPEHIEPEPQKRGFLSRFFLPNG